MRPPRLGERSAGLLLHLASLPGPGFCGSLGPEAGCFLEFLEKAGCRWWQMLPVAPPGFGDSPYQALSAFAGNPLLISLEALVEEGWLEPSELPREGAEGRADFQRAAQVRHNALRAAFERFEAARKSPVHRAFEAYRRSEAKWLRDWVLFVSLKAARGGRPWTEWEPALRDRDPVALKRAARDHAVDLRYQEFLQFLFDRQWSALRRAAHRRGVALLGDVPIFLAHDSADVWANRDLFQLDAAGNPTAVAGVPPDDFSAEGQRWGNPLYRWDVLRRKGYAWWVARLSRQLIRFDALRLDHFIGFHRYWEIPVSEPTAAGGTYRPGPGAHFFEVLKRRLGKLPLVVEDLGVVVPEVEALRDRFGFPGMRVLQFAFGNPENSRSPHLPENHVQNSVVYTGTHDNDTARGWFEKAPEAERRFALAKIGGDGTEIHWDLIGAAWRSPAFLAVAPVQDVLGLGREARLNTPGTAGSNWVWRLERGALTDGHAKRLRALALETGRIGKPAPRRARSAKGRG